VIDEDQIGVERLTLLAQFLGLAGTDEEFRIGFFDARTERTDHGGPGRPRQLAKLVDIIDVATRRAFANPARLQQQRAFTFAGTFEQSRSAFHGFRVGAARMHTFAADTHVAARHDRGNGVLVDHLAYRIAQQNDELVEGFDRALQFDAIDQIDRHRHALATQRIEERILQRLTLGHSSSPARFTNLCEPTKGRKPKWLAANASVQDVEILYLFNKFSSSAAKFCACCREILSTCMTSCGDEVRYRLLNHGRMPRIERVDRARVAIGAQPGDLAFGELARGVDRARATFGKIDLAIEMFRDLGKLCTCSSFRRKPETSFSFLQQNQDRNGSWLSPG
jgi:hypothetical protein